MFICIQPEEHSRPCNRNPYGHDANCSCFFIHDMAKAVSCQKREKRVEGKHIPHKFHGRFSDNKKIYSIESEYEKSGFMRLSHKSYKTYKTYNGKYRTPSPQDDVFQGSPKKCKKPKKFKKEKPRPPPPRGVFFKKEGGGAGPKKKGLGEKKT